MSYREHRLQSSMVEAVLSPQASHLLLNKKYTYTKCADARHHLNGDMSQWGANKKISCPMRRRFHILEQDHPPQDITKNTADKYSQQKLLKRDAIIQPYPTTVICRPMLKTVHNVFPRSKDSQLFERQGSWLTESPNSKRVTKSSLLVIMSKSFRPKRHLCHLKNI